MIKAKATYKKARRTPSQRALAKVLPKIARQTVKDAKAAASSFQQSGALKASLGFRIVSKGGTATAVVGARSRFLYTKKGRNVIPNKYAFKEENKQHYLVKALDGKQALLMDAAKEALQIILPEKL